MLPQNCHKQFTRFLLVWGMLFALKLGISQSQPEVYGVEIIPFTGELAGFHGTCILQDREGFMWFGSNRHGLCRYDGNSFKRYTHNPSDTLSLSFDWVYNLVEDREGYIWIGTFSGLNRFDKSTETFRRFFPSPGNQNAIPGATVNSLIEDREGFIWIGTRRGLCRFDWSTETFKNYVYHSKDNSEESTFNHVTHLYQDNSGTIWICEDRYNLHRITKESDSGEFITRFPGIVMGMLEDRSGRFWVQTNCGVYLLDRDRLTYEPYVFDQKPNPPGDSLLRAITEDSQGNIWVRYADGIYKYNQHLEPLYHSKLEEANEYLYPGNTRLKEQRFYYGLENQLWEDLAGTFWFYGTNGIHKLIPKRSYYKIYDPHQSGESRIICIQIEGDESIWIATQNGIFNLVTPTLSYTNYPLAPSGKSLIPDSAVGKLELYLDQRSMLWIAQNRTLYSLSLSKRQLSVAVGNLPDIFNETKLIEGNYLLFKDSGDRIWIGTNFQTPCYYDLKENKLMYLVHNPGSSDSIRPGSAIRHETETNSLLATGGNGIYKIVPPFIQVAENEVMPTDVFEYKPDEGSDEFIPVRLTNASYLDNDGTLWIGTHGYGLLRLIEKKGSDSGQFDFELTVFNSSHGLIHNHVMSILDDEQGNLWLGTFSGLSKFSKQTESFSNYTFGQAVSRSGFLFESAARNERGELFFGTGNGMISFHPDSLQAEPVISPVKLTEIRIHNQVLRPGEHSILQQSICLTDQIELNHDQNHLSIEFALLNYVQAESNRYKYMLEGLDPEWIVSGTRNYASYANLKPGKYLFRVIASNYSGAWNEEGAKLGITIHPPPWLAWWAYILYGFILVSIALLFRRYYLNRTKLEHELEIERIEKEKAEEIDHIKSRFFANISHEFRTPLTLILGPMEDLIRKKTEKLELSRDQVGAIHRNSQRLHELINQLLDISKLETGSVKLRVSEGNAEAFIKTRSLSFLSLAERKGIKYGLLLPDSNRSILFDPDKLEKILCNLISNAFKFTATGDTVEVSLQFPEEAGDQKRTCFEIRVLDTGQGIPADKLSKVFDRFYQVSDSNTRSAEGTGIGLALTKELVDLYRGEIGVESEMGKGSTFTVRLPYLKEDFREEEICKSTPSEKSELEVFRTETIPSGTEALERDRDLSRELLIGMPMILIVEDNEDMRKYITDILHSNYRILSAENGKIGLQKAKSNIPDLILSDVMMPEMDGIEMCKCLRKDQFTNHIPVILLTARADKGSKLDGLETGADDYLIKPFDKDELRVRIKNLLDQRARLREKYREEFTEDAGAKIPSPRDLFLKRLHKILDQHISNPDFNVEQLSEQLHMSRSQLYRKIVAITGCTPNEFIRNFRLRKAAGLFRSGHTHINRVMLEVGYLHQSYFSKCFLLQYGSTPTEYIRQNGS